MCNIGQPYTLSRNIPIHRSKILGLTHIWWLINQSIDDQLKIENLPFDSYLAWLPHTIWLRRIPFLRQREEIFVFHAKEDRYLISNSLIGNQWSTSHLMCDKVVSECWIPTLRAELIWSLCGSGCVWASTGTIGTKFLCGWMVPVLPCSQLRPTAKTTCYGLSVSIENKVHLPGK